MKNPYHLPGTESQASQNPPGQEIVGICLSGAAAVLGTPYLFQLIGPFVEDLIYQAYGSRGLADVMYFLSFAFSGAVIYGVCRMILWYVLAAIVAFLSMRAGGLIVI